MWTLEIISTPHHYLLRKEQLELGTYATLIDRCLLNRVAVAVKVNICEHEIPTLKERRLLYADKICDLN